MSYDNPTHRPVLEAEGLRQWIAPQLEAYAELREASAQQGFLKRTLAHATRLSGAIENPCQPALMLIFAIEGAAHGCEGIRQAERFRG